MATRDVGGPGEIKKHLEIETYMYAGVAVRVRIDYDAEHISLLDQGNGAKKWVFAERQLEYMQGWQNILAAMKYAIEQATKKLEKHVRAVEKEKADLMNRAMREIEKEKRHEAVR